ncbi:MAG: glycosyltransferase family 39 protein [Candidatus Levybacteria bacterium]|nr:glycosyltransferase family 39 protein [Candidatus Levybacteria bacterium]
MENSIKNFLNKQHILLLLLIIIGSFFRLYNLNWGAPYYFHPDERNIASSVTQLHFPDQMNPHFFAYGSLSTYVTYFTGLILNFFFTCHLPPITCLSAEALAKVDHVTFEQAIIISRFLSAFFSVGIIPLIYLVGRQLVDRKTGLLAASLATFSTGLIQSAHFGTVEISTAFFSLFLFHMCTLLFKNSSLNKTLVASLIFGILIATKITSLILLPLPMLAMYIYAYSRKHIPWHQKLLMFISTASIFLLLAIFIYMITNPFTFISFAEFRNSMSYESGVALGNLPVFYTGEFFGQAPVLFQFTKIYPFLLNPLLAIIFIPAFFYVVYDGFKKRSSNYLLLITYYLLLFIPNAFIFAKWTRYIVPTLPFIYLIIAITINSLYSSSEDRTERSRSARTIIAVLFIIPSIIFAISYLITAFVQQDSRIAAAKWAKINMLKDSKIISEVYDLGITPFNNSFNYNNIILFNFYDLDNNSPDATGKKLTNLIETSEYIILPSQRILKTRLQNPKQFPKGYSFYYKLLGGKLGYMKIYETPCDIWCKITYFNDPVNLSEITANVFERPTVLIFQKLNIK